MVRETPHSAPQQAPAEAAPLFDRLGRRSLTRLALGTLTASLALPFASPRQAEAHTETPRAARATHSLDYVGPTSNRVWVTNLDQARKAAARIAATNATTERFFEPYNMSQAVIDADHSRLCNAVEADREYNLIPEISFLGVYRDKQDGNKLKHNFVPSSAGAVSRYLNFVKTILLDIAGPNANKPGPDGSPPCVEQPITKVIVEDFDEVNSYPNFNSSQDPAQKYAYLESRAIPDYEKDVSDINNAFEAGGVPPQEASPQFTLIHAVGAIATGSHNPVGFLKEFDQDLKEDFGITDPNFILAVHPYASTPGSTPAQVEASLNLPIRQELDSAWGKDTVPVFYDEFGVGAISPGRRVLYGPRSLQAATVSERTQGQDYWDAIAEAASEDDVVGAMTFQSQDVRNDGWPDGEYYPNGDPKDSLKILSQANHDALSGDFQQ